MVALVLTVLLSVSAGAGQATLASSVGPQDLEELARDLRRGNPQERRSAAVALGRLGQAGAPALAEALVSSRDPLVKLAAIHYLRKIDAIPGEAAPAVGEFIGEQDACGVASLDAAMWQLEHLGTFSAFLTQAIFGSSEKDRRELGLDVDRCCRKEAELALAGMGVEGVVELLERSRKSKGPAGRPGEMYSSVRIALACAARDAGPACVGALAEALGGTDRQLQASALVGLGAIGPPAASAAPRMMELAAHRDEAIRWRALQALGSVRASGVEVETLLLAALQDRSVRVRTQAARALLLTGVQQQPARACIAEALLDKDATSTTWALAVVGDVGVDYPGCVDLLAAGLERDSEAAVVVSACALGRLGDAARPVLPQLEAANERYAGIAGSAVAHAMKQLGAK